MIVSMFVPKLFETEFNSVHFEDVCIDLYREETGIPLVPTSRSWDLGRDGRSVRVGTPAAYQRPVLCASLNGNIDAKVEKDITRLRDTTSTEAIVFCTTQPLSELACDTIEARIKELNPNLTDVVILGQLQLSKLGERHEEVIERHYRGELAHLNAAIAAESKSDDQPHAFGLRLALLTQTGDDATQVREQMAQDLILQGLSAVGPSTPDQLAHHVSSRLHLPKSLSTSYVTAILSQLAQNGHAVRHESVYHITELGQRVYSDRDIVAGENLLEGRHSIHNAIKELSGHSLHSDQFDRLWGLLQDGLASLFYEHGVSIVHMISSIISGDEPDTRVRTAKELLVKLSDRIPALFTSEEQGQEVQQAVIDTFSEPDSTAFQWLTQVCSAYVTMCSLGFEPLSSEEIKSILRRILLVPDSDVIISLICDGEANHDQIRRIVLVWQSIGGKLLAAKPVLEEVAYHAWISTNDYNQMAHQLHKLEKREVARLAGNAFVRSFHQIAGERLAPKYWRQYISEYRGSQEFDYSRILAILREEFGFQELPDAGGDYSQFIESVRDRLVRLVKAEFRARDEFQKAVVDLGYRAEDKCRRDALILGAAKGQRDRAVLNSTGKAVIVSSANLMRHVADEFKESFGSPDVVVAAPALAWLLTLVPGVQMSLRTLRAVLFDRNIRGQLNQVQRFAYRIISSAGEHDVPWSRRVTLAQKLEHRMFQDARDRGEPLGQTRARLLYIPEPDYPAEVVAEVLRDMAIPAALEQQNEELRRENEELRRRLEERQNTRAVDVQSAKKTEQKGKKSRRH